METDYINNIKLFDNPETLQKLLKELSDVIKNKSKNQVIRSLAAIQLKNAIYSKEEVSNTFIQHKWLKLTVETRNYIKENSLAALAVDKKRPSLVAALVGHLACVETLRGLWPECIPQLIANVNDPTSSDTLKETSLESLCFIFQDISNIQVLVPFLDDLLAMIEACIRSQGSDFIKFSALNIIISSDTLTSQFFISKKESFDKIVEVSLSSTQSDDMKLVSLKYFEKMILNYVSSQKLNENLFKLSLETAKSESEDLVVQSIHIWIHTLKLLLKSNETDYDAIIQNFPSNLETLIKDRLIPVLFVNLCEQKETEEDDQLTMFKSACICLLLSVAYLQEELVTQLTEFLNTNIDLDKGWQCIDAGLIALGSLLKLKNLATIKDSLRELREEKLDILNDLLASSDLDANVFVNNYAVRNTCECLIYFICKVLPEYCDKFEHMSEFHMRSFKFFLFNKNLLLDWSDSFKIKFKPGKRYRVDLKELANKDSNSDVLSIASSNFSDSASSAGTVKLPKPVLVKPPKQPVITLDELNSALKNLKNIGNRSTAIITEPTRVLEASALEEENNEIVIKSGEATPTNNDEAPAETIEIADQAFEQHVEVVEKLNEVAAVLTIDVSKTEDMTKAAGFKTHKQMSPVEKTVPAFLLVKLKHVDKAPHDLYTD